jgi:hypothetical protein
MTSTITSCIFSLMQMSCEPWIRGCERPMFCRWLWDHWTKVSPPTGHDSTWEFLHTISCKFMFAMGKTHLPTHPEPIPEDSITKQIGSTTGVGSPEKTLVCFGKALVNQKRLWRAASCAAQGFGRRASKRTGRIGVGPAHCLSLELTTRCGPHSNQPRVIVMASRSIVQNMRQQPREFLQPVVVPNPINPG